MKKKKMMKTIWSICQKILAFLGVPLVPVLDPVLLVLELLAALLVLLV